MRAVRSFLCECFSRRVHPCLALRLRKMSDKNKTRHDALHMLTVGAAKRMVVDGKRITTQDLNYTILKRQYMYAQKPSTAQAPQGCRCLGVTGYT